MYWLLTSHGRIIRSDSFLAVTLLSFCMMIIKVNLKIISASAHGFKKKKKKKKIWQPFDTWEIFIYVTDS